MTSIMHDLIPIDDRLEMSELLTAQIEFGGMNKIWTLYFVDILRVVLLTHEDLTA